MASASISSPTSASDASASAPRIRLSEILSALSYALDLTEGQPMGHAIKSCVLGMRLADAIGMSATDKSALYYALLLKDSGCSSNAARMCQIFGSDDRTIKRSVKTIDWTRLSEGFYYVRSNALTGFAPWRRAGRIVKVAINSSRDAQEVVSLRCTRGASIARDLGFPESTANAIYNLDEHWNGRGFPQKLRGEEIPLFSRILSLCQTLEVFAATHGVETAWDVLQRRSGRWFDPQLVRAARVLIEDSWLWHHLADPQSARRLVMESEPGEEILAGEDRLTCICEGFASIIDAKSPWTSAHSQGVARAAVGMAGVLGFTAEKTVMLRRAALLHDIGKLSLPNTILDKPGKLTDQEFALVRQHPYYSQRILEQIASFRELAEVAGAHHERLDGSGYHQKMSGKQLSVETRVLAVADVYDALSAERPYRASLAPEQVFDIMSRDVPHALCPDAFAALQQWHRVNSL